MVLDLNHQDKLLVNQRNLLLIRIMLAKHRYVFKQSIKIINQSMFMYETMVMVPYTCRYTPRNANRHCILIDYGGVTIPDSPFSSNSRFLFPTIPLIISTSDLAN